MNQYVLDLETTTSIDVANKTRKELLFEEEATFICATMYAPIQETKPIVQEFYGKKAAENAILDLPTGRYYTWNGARFDIHYIYHLLEKAGYKKQEETRKTESKKRQLKKYHFSYLLAGRKLISLLFKNENGLVEIRDACLLFTCTLKKFIQNTCPEYPKLEGTYNYHTYREFEEDFSDSDKEYCRYDIYGFSVGMYRLSKEFEREFGINILESFTAGSFSMKYARLELTKHLDGKDEKEAFIQELFPDVSFDRKFVMGGRTFLNPKHRNKVLTGLYKLDRNSSYPAAMVQSKLPYGKMKKLPMNSTQLKEFLHHNEDTYVFARLTDGVVKYNDMFSPIITRDDLNTREYPTIAGSADGVYVDDNTLRDPKFIYEDCIFMCYIFEAKKGIMGYMEHIFHLKNRYKLEEKFALELAVKIILNATYGKFIQREDVKEYDFFDGVILPTGKSTNIRTWYHYAPMGAAITANCRYELTQYMNLLGERFVYCDTDSLVFYGDIPPEIPLGSALGEWKVEASPEGMYNKKKDKYENKTGQGIFFQRKTYAMEIDNHTHIIFCGISSNAVKQRFPRTLSDIKEFQFMTDEEILEAAHDKINEYELFPNGVPIERLKQEMDLGIVFNVTQGNHTQNGIVLVERARLKKYTERY